MASYNEEQLFRSEVEQVENFFRKERFSKTQRPYSAQDVN